MGHPNFHDRWTGDWCFTTRAKHQIFDFTSLLAKVKGSSLREAFQCLQGKAWQGDSLQANIYLQERDQMGWGVCHHPHRFRLLNLNSPMRSSSSKTPQESPSLYKHFHLHDSFIQPLLLICACGDWHPNYRIFIKSIYRVKACVKIHFDQLSS